jgi:arabinogalactan endo-1,4-beta-galactosidase
MSLLRQNMKTTYIRKITSYLLFLVGICTLGLTTVRAGDFANGADVSWLQQMEATGYTFYDINGKTNNCLQILQSLGVDSIRLRTWVNPSTNPTNGGCSESETVAMATEAHNLGMKVMINFEYSDSWAGLGNQPTPVEWTNESFSQLCVTMSNYTYGVMYALKTNGVSPAWVQIGDEIDDGMLYPYGELTWPFTNSVQWSNLSTLIKFGYGAVKAVSPNTKVVIHLANSLYDSDLRTFCDNLITSNSTPCDVIGLSYYTYWEYQDYTLFMPTLSSNMNDMVSRYNKPIMICEIGNWYEWPENTYDYASETINAVKALTNGYGLGVFYWEPEAAYNWSDYQLSAWWTNTAEPTMAMSAFLQPNYIKNPGFESGDLRNWSMSGNTNAVFVNPGGVLDANTNCMCSMWLATPYQTSIYQTFSNLNYGKYTLSAWVQNGGGQTSCWMYATNFAGAEYNYTLPETAGTNWVKLTIGNINVTTNGKCQIGLYSNAKSNNWCDISDLRFYAQNIVKNPGFQTGDSSDWNYDGNTNDIYVNTGGHSGKYYLDLWASTAYQTTAYQDFSDLPNGTYTLSAWVQNGGGQTYCWMYANNFAGTQIDYNLPITNNWTQITITNINITNGECEVGLYSDANSNNWCNLDDIELYPDNQVRNSGFETPEGNYWLGQSNIVTGDLSEWNTWYSGTNNANYIQAGGHFGKFCLGQWLNVAYESSAYQDFVNLSNGTYTLSAWVQNGGGQTYCQLYANPNFVGAQIDYNLPVTNAWTLIAITNIVITNGECEIGLYSDANSNNWCEMDDVVFKK